MEIPLEKRAELDSFTGRDLILGIRAESIQFSKGADKPRGVRFQAVVEAIESLGGETLCTVETGAHTLTSRSFAGLDRADAGHRVQFEVDASQVLLFDPETTRRI